MRTSAPLAVLAVLLGLFALSVPAHAENQISGIVYQVDRNDVYITLADHTAIRIPIATARFVAHGAPVAPMALKIGTPVDVFYTPVFGFQNFYLSSSSLAPSPTYVYRWYGPDGIWHYSTVPYNSISTQVDTYIWYDGAWHRQ